MKGPKRFKSEEKRALREQAKPLEEIIEVLEKQVKEHCQKADKFVLEFVRQMQDHLVGEGIDDKVYTPAQREHPSELYLPGVHYHNISFTYEGMPAGVGMVRTGMNRPQTDLMEEIQKTYRKSMGQLKSMIGNGVQMLHLQYERLLELTMVEQPLRQRKKRDSALLLLKRHGRAVYDQVYFNLDTGKETDAGEIRRSDHEDESWDSYLRKEARDNYLYIVSNPSRKVRTELMLTYVKKKLIEKRIGKAIAATISNFHNVGDTGYPQHRKYLKSFTEQSFYMGQGEPSEELLNKLLEKADKKTVH